MTENLPCPEHLLWTSSLVPRPSPLPAGHGRGHQGGFSLPLAIFIIVIMALIGTAMVSLTQTGQRSVASEVQSIRTFYAAETGAQTAVARLLPVDGSPGDPCSDGSLIEINGDNLPPLPPAELSGCTVELSCTPLGPDNDYYRITSDARCSFAGNDTRRQIEVMVHHPN